MTETKGLYSWNRINRLLYDSYYVNIENNTVNEMARNNRNVNMDAVKSFTSTCIRWYLIEKQTAASF